MWFRLQASAAVSHCLSFASRWWSLLSQSSVASLCPSFWWNKISLQFPSTGEWLRKRGETRTHTHTPSSYKPTLINICSIELWMLSMFMEHEASSVNSTHHWLQRGIQSSNAYSSCVDNSPSSLLHRLSRYQQFKDFQRRILVATNLFGRGMDIERVNIVFNYDMPEDSDTYLHRVRTAHSPLIFLV